MSDVGSIGASGPGDADGGEVAAEAAGVGTSDATGDLGASATLSAVQPVRASSGASVAHHRNPPLDTLLLLSNKRCSPGIGDRVC